MAELLSDDDFLNAQPAPSPQLLSDDDFLSAKPPAQPQQLLSDDAFMNARPPAPPDTPNVDAMGNSQGPDQPVAQAPDAGGGRGFVNPPTALVPQAPAPAPQGPAPGANAAPLPDVAPTLRDRFADAIASLTGGPTAEQQRQQIQSARASNAVAMGAGTPGGPSYDDASEAARQAVGGMSQIPQAFAEGAMQAGTLGIARPTVPMELHSGAAGVAKGAGALAGFVGGLPMAAGTAAAGALGIPALMEGGAAAGGALGVGADVAGQAATLGLAGGAQSLGGAALDSHSVSEGVKQVGSDIMSNAMTGGLFGAAGHALPGSGVGQWLGRAVGVSLAQDLIHGTRPNDDRPTEQKAFDYLQNIWFTKHGAAGPTPSQQFGRALGQDVGAAQFSPDVGITTLNPNLARTPGAATPDTAPVQASILPGVPPTPFVADVAAKLNAILGTQPDPAAMFAGRPIAGYTNEQLQSISAKPLSTPVRAKIDAEIARRAPQGDQGDPSTQRLPGDGGDGTQGQPGVPVAGDVVRPDAGNVGTDPNLAAGVRADAGTPADTVQQPAAAGVDAGELARPLTPVDQVIGQPINRNWTQFAPDSGTLNIPRADMPQISADHRGALVNFLNARGVEHTQEEVPASSLKPTQAEFSPQKVQRAQDYTGGDRSVLVSSDNHILDGTHQWMAKLDADQPVKVIRLDAPIQDLLRLAHQFPSSTVAGGARRVVGQQGPRDTTQIVANNEGVAGKEPSGSAPGDTSQRQPQEVDEATGLPLNADGTVTVYHHTSAAKAAEIRRTGTLKAAAEPDVYVTTHPTTDTGYGDTAIPIRVNPDRLQVDDEFPNGRTDYRLSVGRPGGSIKVAVQNEHLASGQTDAARRTNEQDSQAGTRANPEVAAQAPDAAGAARAPDAAQAAGLPAAGAADVQAPRVIARAGRTPNSADDLSLHPNPDGTLTPRLGKHELLDFESSQPIRLPSGVSDADAKTAIRNAGAVSSKTNFFAPAGEPAKPSTIDRRSANAKARMALNPETDTVLQALAKMGGIRRDIMAKEFGLQPEELKHTVSTGGLKGFPFRKTGGMDLDRALTNLREAGYFTGVPEEDVRAKFEEAVYHEMGGGKELTPQGQMRAGADQAREAEQDHQDRINDPNYDPFEPSGTEHTLDDFGADHLEQSGYAAASDDVKATTQQMLHEAQALGIDTEGLREDAARETGEQSEDFYHARLQAGTHKAITQARADAARTDAGRAGAGGQDHGQVAGDQGRAEEGLTLQPQTAADLKAKTERESNAAALDQRAQIDAERDHFSLQQQSQDGRTDTTGDMFGGVREPESAYTEPHGAADPLASRTGTPADATAPAGSGASAPGRPAGADAGAVDAVRGAGVAVPDRARITGLGVAADIKRVGSTALVGRVVKSHADLADMAQVYRDPRYETFRVFFTKNGEIVHATGISARMPGHAPMLPHGMSEAEYLGQFRDNMARTGADGYYLLHNHPSGNPTPSREDIALTERLAGQVPGMLGHVVINSGKYAVIQPPRTSLSGIPSPAMAETIYRDFGPDMMLKASVPSPFLNKPISKPDDLVAIGKSMQKPGWITLVGAGSDNKVRLIADAPSSILGRPDAVLAATVRGMMRRSGARYMHIIGSDADIASKAVRSAVAAGVLRDAVGETGRPLSERGVTSGRPAFEQTRGKGVAEAAADTADGTERDHDALNPPRDAEGRARLPGAQMLDAATTRMSSMIDHVLSRADIYKLVAPMSDGAQAPRAMAQAHINAERQANYKWHTLDDAIVKNFTQEQRRAMWDAADQQNEILSRGDTPGSNDGINALPNDQRAVVDLMHDYSTQLWERAQSAGLVKGDGVKYWAPRMMAMLDANGEYSRPSEPGQKATSAGEGRNIVTSAPSAKQRKYDTSFETAAAMEAKGGELVRDIRTMPMAMARFERAIAGRELISGIKEHGEAIGKDYVSDVKKPGFFTMDHPAFTTYRPRMVTDADGKVTPAIDQTGKTVMDKTPIYISKEFEGPLKAIMTTSENAVYRGYMLLKSKEMSGIMFSPFIHQMVIAGRAFAYAGLKLPALYVTGHVARADHEMMQKAIGHGMVPISGTNHSMVDVGDIARGIGKVGGWGDPNESWIGLGARAAGNAVKSGLGDTLKAGVDKAGNFVHGTLLWNRIGDLQAGIFKDAYQKGIAKGMDDNAAATVAAHMANRYAGAVGRENMSAIARQFANVLLFSRSFNMGNVGAVKDVFYGLPAGLRAQLFEGSSPESARIALSYAKRKALTGLIKDLAATVLVTSLVQDMVKRHKDDPWAKQLGDAFGGYGKRAGAMWDNIKAHPGTADSYDPYRLSSTWGNEPGKVDRVDMGAQPSGRHEYMRLPTGKVVEDTLGWLGHPVDTFGKKMSPMAKSAEQIASNDKGYGTPVWDPSTGFAHVAMDMALHLLKAQTPFDTLRAGYDLTQGKATPMDKEKLSGNLTGLSISQGHPLGPEGAVAQQVDDRVNLSKKYVMEGVRRDLKYGDVSHASDQLANIGLSNAEVNKILNKEQGKIDGAAPKGNGMMKRFNTHATEDEQATMGRLGQ